MVTGDDVFSNSNQQCGKTVLNNSSNYWRCDSLKERVNLANYKDNLANFKDNQSMDYLKVLKEFERDVKSDDDDRNVKKFIKQPTGWGRGVTFNEIGLSDFIVKEIEDFANSKIAIGDCDLNKWCERDPNT